MKKPTPFGKYLLLERINIGGMAEVFRAKAFGVEGFERLVAVKRILSNIAEDKEFIRMFIEEAKLSVQLNHANIAQIFDLGVVDASYYIALEHVHGRDLRGIFDRCRQIGEAMPVAQACFVAMKVCEGLDYAHNKRDQAGRELALVHRDVSPQNILVSFEGEVKLIDFGIAKAAGTGAKTQAGILKGKFGYMSPEQVRGLQVDRRSDVFSCGIVLYELLTGERLFVGESDFSTLEKVRNVEILPPSTYNRKIPEELERIVLKALAKDVEDRYQNAIDLHDELQAFVYTAGEFYSRKDLAGWMKKTFGKEIEDETAKLEGYRQLKPPPASDTTEPIDLVPGVPTGLAAGISSGMTSGVPVPRTQTGSKPVSRRTTQPPPPPSRSQPVPVVPPPSTARSQPVTARPPTDEPGRPHRPGPSSWDDDDLETRIFQDDEQRSKSKLANLPLQPPVASSPGLTLPDEIDDAAPPEEWPVEASPAPRPRPQSGGVANGKAVAPQAFPSGSSNAAAPIAPEGRERRDTREPRAESRVEPSGRVRAESRAESRAEPSGRVARAESRAEPSGRVAAPIAGRELSAGNRLVSGPYDAPFDSMSGPMAVPHAIAGPQSAPVAAPAFGARIAGRRPTTSAASADRQRTILTFALAGAALAAIVVIIVILVGRRSAAPAVAPPLPAAVKLPPPPADPNTGFDLYVSPAGITQWKLDGETRTDRLPSRIRGIAPGPHAVQIDPPPGFLSQSQQVAVELGKAPRVDITLQAIAGIHGVFESSPAGATVSLIVDGKRQTIGPSPARAALDPRSSYQVLFEKPGYVSVNRPIAFSGGMEERVIANLEKAAPPPSPAPETAPHVSPPAPAPRPSPPPAAREVHKATEPAAEPAAAPASDHTAEPTGDKAQGVLVLGSKPPCEIAIDGSATGLHTPQKEIKLPVGRHRVTLSNAEFSIKETFTVDIKADAPEKMIKDYSDQLPK